MNLKILILTTQTIHHTWFIHELLNSHKNIQAILETTSIHPSFEVYHPFEKQRDDYELEYFFQNKNVLISDLCPTYSTTNINLDENLELISKMQPNIVITFGTRKIKPTLINLLPNKMLNLHGGDSEKYRGLDSQLWTIYHEDFFNIATTLHFLNESLDDGELINKITLDISKIQYLYQLRSINTNACIKLCLEACDEFINTKKIKSKKQISSNSRYYSFMPRDLKEVCVKKFNKYKETIL